MKSYLTFATALLLMSVTSSNVGVTAEHKPGVLVEDVHIEYHPSPSLVGSASSGGIGSFHGSYLSDWSSDWSVLSGSVGGRLHVARCVDIPSNMSLCRTIGYKQMRLPNLLDHDSVAETTQQAGSWVPLLNIRCHPDTQMFLCSLFAPVCLDRPIYPCRTLCEAVRSGCESLMLKYGFPWPDMLQCDKFPLDNDLCIGIQSDQRPTDLETESEATTCPSCEQPTTYENIVDNFCESDFVMRVQVDHSSPNAVSIALNDVKLLATRKKIYKKGGLKSRELRGLTNFFIENGAHCRCSAFDLTSQQQPSSRTSSAGQSNRASSGNYIVMGRRSSDNRLVLSFIQPVDRRSSAQTRALSAMRHNRACKSSSDSSPTDNTNKSPKKLSTTPSSSVTRRPTTRTTTATTTTTTTMATTTSRRKEGRRKSEGNNQNGEKRMKNGGRMQSAVESGKQTTMAPAGRRRPEGTGNAGSKVKSSRSGATPKTRR